jgi:hypothetical protein
MGDVYRALDPHLWREATIKVLPSASAADSGRLLGFEQEAHTEPHRASHN